MRTGRAQPDAELTVPPLPGTVPPLRVDDPELALAGEPGEGRVLLEGERGSVRVRERGGIETIHLAGHVLARDLSLDAGPVVNRVASPASLRRERVVDGATVEEIVLLPPRLALLALQLRSPGGSREIAGRLTLLPWAGPLRWHIEGARLVAVAREAPELQLVLAVSPEAGTVEAEPDEGGGLLVRLRIPGGDDPTLLLGAGPTGGMNPLAPAAHLAGHARMAAAAPAEGLELRTGVRELEEGVAWARTRLATAARREGRSHDGLEPSRIFWSGLGALAASDEEAAARYLEALDGAVAARKDEGSGESASADEAPDMPGVPPLPAPPLPVLLAARHALTTGDSGPALRQAARVDAGAAGDAGGPDEAALWSLALGSLADALRWSAGEAAADRYRALGEELGARARLPTVPDGSGRPGGGVRLPMAGETTAPTPAGEAAAALRALLAAPGEDGPAPGSTLPRGLAAWAGFREGRAGEAWSLWRGVLSRGMDGSDPGPGRWDDGRPSPEAPRTGLLLATLVHGLLGWFPDAPVGRAVLAPRIPGHLTAFGVGGLRVGSATVELRYEREGPLRRYRITPTGGRAPVTLVLEPLVGLATVTATRLDGEAVELDPRPGPAGWTVVPLQVPLDGPRVLEVEGEEESRRRGNA